MTAEVVVAGHLCLDVIPSLSKGVSLEPGHLFEVGTAQVAPGGGVANVGLSLTTLGIEAALLGRVGDDAFGAIVKELLSRRNPRAAETVRTVPQEGTSYTIVISPPGEDRLFLHHAGPNDSYSSADIDMDLVADARLFYLGYPPLMRRFYEDGGQELADLFQHVKDLGVTTALDMAMPDPNTDSGRADWGVFLTRVLPYTDLFMPSIEETLFMLDQETYSQGAWCSQEVPGNLHAELAQRLLDLGVGVVGLKLGELGLYLRSASMERLEGMGRAAPANLFGWADRELWRPVFNVEVGGTTGAGDATVAGFIAALLKGFGVEEAITLANAVGACCVEAADATSGVRSWEGTLERVYAGWPSLAHSVTAGWHPHQESGAFRGPRDRGQV